MERARVQRTHLNTIDYSSPPFTVLWPFLSSFYFILSLSLSLFLPLFLSILLFTLSPSLSGSLEHP